MDYDISKGDDRLDTLVARQSSLQCVTEVDAAKLLFQSHVIWIRLASQLSHVLATGTRRATSHRSTTATVWLGLGYTTLQQQQAQLSLAR